MNWTCKLGFAAASAIALAATPAMAFQGSQNGWTGGEYGYHDQYQPGQYRYSHRHRHEGGEYGSNQFGRNDMAPPGLRGPRYGRDGYANFQNGPYRNPSANNWNNNAG